MRLIVLPDDGISEVVTAIRKARHSLRITIFRCDLPEIEKALGEAVTRGVQVHARIAHTNRGGEKILRKLEQRLLGAGVTLSRSDDDLVRYHDKVLIVDEQTLFVLGFNYTRLDGRSRSFGIVTRQPGLVAEAEKLFASDAARQPHSPVEQNLVVSPLNARARGSPGCSRRRSASSASTTRGSWTARCWASFANAPGPGSTCA